MKALYLMDSFDWEISFDDISRAKNYYDYFEPDNEEQIEFNNSLYACNDFYEMADVLNHFYKRNDFIGHDFYVKEIDIDE